MSLIIENLERMLASGQDSAMLRFGLGKAYLNEQQGDSAAEHLEKAVEQDPDYSAAWKLLGKAYLQAGRDTDAERTLRHGIEVAEKKGDVQAAKEMGVFLRRLEKAAARK